MSKIKSALAALVCLSSFSTAAIAAPATVQMTNQSQYVIMELYLSPTSSNEWGPDQLGQHVIAPGDTFELSGIECTIYDVRLVGAEAGQQCTVMQVPLCAGQEQWVFTNANLENCAP
ncbi:MAG: hypothetical protein AAFV53_35980 [Myxococcota bacterium]